MSTLNIFGILDAYATDAVVTTGASVPTPSTTSGLISMLPMIIIIVAFMYLLVIRPQNKRVKTHRALMESLKVGDEIITSSGIFGKISKINDDSIVLEIANGVEIKIQRAAISTNLPKGTVHAA
jgi:preprotein translocase subunit YajC